MANKEAIKYLQQLYPNGGHCWLDEQRIEAISMAVKALQEEPVSINFERELYKVFGQVKDFTLGMRIAKWFYDMGKNHQEPVSEDLEEAAEHLSKIYAGEGSVDPKREGFAFYIGFKNGAKWQKEQFEKNRLAHCDALTEEQAQIESDFVIQHLKENSRTPTFIDAIKYGMRLQKEQMMADAIDGEVGYWNLRGLSVNVKLPRSVEEGNKVKVIVIKEG